MKSHLSLALSCALLFLPSEMRAATYTWTGGVDNTWSNAGNWSPGGGPPSANTDTAQFLTVPASTTTITDVSAFTLGHFIGSLPNPITLNVSLLGLSLTSLPTPATVDVSGSATYNFSATPIAISTAALQITNTLQSGASLKFGSITLGPGMVINGTGTTEFAGTSSGPNAVTVNGGTLNLNAGSGPSISSNSFTINTGAQAKVINFANQFSASTVITLNGTAQFSTSGTQTVSNVVWGSPSATLSGTGTLTSTSGFANSGTVKPGSDSSVGTLSLVGNYSQTAAGTLFINVQGSEASKLNVSGTASLDGTLTVNLLSDLSDFSQSIPILDASAISGEFATVNYTNFPAGLEAGVTYSPSQIWLTFEDPEAFSSFIGFQDTLFNQVNQRTLLAISRNRAVRGRLAATGANTLASWSDPASLKPEQLIASLDPMPYEQEYCLSEACNPFSAYVSVLGSIGDLDSFSGQNGYDFHSVGGLAGFDYAGYYAGVGGQLGAQKIKGDVDHHGGHFDIVSAFGRLYATYVPLECYDWFLEGSLEGTLAWYDIHRNAYSLTAKSKPKGWGWDAYLASGYDFNWNCFRVTPLAAIQYIDVRVDSYHEHGAGAQNVDVGNQKAHSFRTMLGLGGAATWCRPCFSGHFEVHGYWQHDYSDQKGSVVIASSGFNLTSNVQLLRAGRNFGIAGAEFKGLFKYDLSVIGNYDFQWNNKMHANYLCLTLSKSF